jgi:hypothetical protein
MTEIKSAYWEKEVVVSEIQAGENKIRISVCTKKGRTWVAIREWYKTMTGEYSPGKHGLAFPVENAEELEQYIKAFTDAKTCIG